MRPRRPKDRRLPADPSMRGWHEKVLRDAVGAAAGAAAASAGAAPRLRLISRLISQLTLTDLALSSGAAPCLQLTLEVFLVRNGVGCSPHHLTAGQRRALISRHNGAWWRAARRRESRGWYSRLDGCYDRLRFVWQATRGKQAKRGRALGGYEHRRGKQRENQGNRPGVPSTKCCLKS